MSDLIVNRSDLQSFTQILTGLTDVPEAPKALLLQLVTDIGAAMEDLDEAEVTVFPAPDTIEPGSTIGRQFADAFTPEAVGHGVQVKLHKVHR